ncbi:CapA family protein [Leptolyngbya sp. FACHB-671]|uniref:CapA family protein n=1 Tax=Leptolyngbya sp. FACHB-671 TaxID=2692812 RepID=UPI001687B75E|nr:CapA family protein [Leptolyngbya sp. FACHB-671]MBD2066974.1 CapA family protein [Leptolyngbya sp. FACHB-671]
MANQVNGGSLYPLSTANLARVGDLRAITQWLNACLVPQGLQARVGATKPGYLRVMVEFERSPERDRLIRFICHRLCKLNSSQIKGVQVIAQRAGTSKIVWKQSVRINTPASRTSNPSPPLLTAVRSSASLKPRQAASLDHSVSQQLRSRSLLIGGSAAAAFLVGCGFEVLIQHAGALASQSGAPEATEVSTSQPMNQRSNTVQTDQDEVTVFQQPVLNPDDPTVTLTFGDDAALGTVGATSTLRVSSTGGNQSSRADVATAHLDAPLLQIQPDSLDDETAPEQLQTLIDSQIDLVSLASEQVMEQGADGLEETLKTLEQFGIHSVGAGRNRREASRPEILDVKGQRIAYLGYSDSDLNAARDRAAGVNANPDRRVAADIQAIREQVDWVVVNYHWSKDLEAYPADWQVDLAHLAIDQGADLVVGYHPNVLQGAEIYKGRAIAYSLGNFIFTQNEDTTEDISAENYDTAVLKVSLRENQMRLEFLPVEVRQAKPEIVEGEKADQIMQYMQQASSPFAQPIQSPVVLDKRSQDSPPEIPPPEIPVELSVPEPEQPSVPNSAPSQPSDSFITYPDASTDETQSDRVQPDVIPVEPSEPFTTYPSPESDIPDDSSEPFHAWPDAQLPETDTDDVAQINAVQPELQQTAPSETDITLPSPVELTQAEPIQPEQADQSSSMVVEAEPIQIEEQIAEGETEDVANEDVVNEGDRPPASSEQLTVLKPQVSLPLSEPNTKPAL